jgi:hypothetical protein
VSGQLRLARWLTDPRKPIDPAHAYPEQGVQLRSVCGIAYWSVKLARAEAPARLCSICREVIAGAAFRSLEEIAELEGAPAPVSRTAV